MCSHGGLSQHKNSQHLAFPTPTELTRHTRILHQYLNGMINYTWLYNGISDDYLYQHDPVMKMANFSKNPILWRHQLKLLTLIRRTCGHTTIMFDFNHQSQTFWQVWTSGVPPSSNTNPHISVQQKMFHGVALMPSIRQLTWFRLVTHLGRHTSSRTLVPNHWHHQLGWKQPMNSTHMTPYYFLNNR